MLAELEPLGFEGSILVDDLDTIVAPVSDIHIPIGIDVNSVGVIELERTVALGTDAPAPRLDELPVRRKI
jgi:hypothetical protein